MSQIPLFDPGEGRRLRDEGMRNASQAQRVQVWKWSALDWVKRLPRGTEFTSDDVIRDCGLADEGANRNNVVGAEFHVWARQGLIRDTGKQKKSERTARHGGRIGVWRRL